MANEQNGCVTWRWYCLHEPHDSTQKSGTCGNGFALFCVAEKEGNFYYFFVVSVFLFAFFSLFLFLPFFSLFAFLSLSIFSSHTHPFSSPIPFLLRTISPLVGHPSEPFRVQPAPWRPRLSRPSPYTSPSSTNAIHTTRNETTTNLPRPTHLLTPREGFRTCTPFPLCLEVALSGNTGCTGCSLAHALVHPQHITAVVELLSDCRSRARRALSHTNTQHHPRFTPL